MSDTVPPLSPRMVSKALLETLDYEPVDPRKGSCRSPTTGYKELGVWKGLEVGMWEMTPGVDAETLKWKKSLSSSPVKQPSREQSTAKKSLLSSPQGWCVTWRPVSKTAGMFGWRFEKFTSPNSGGETLAAAVDGVSFLTVTSRMLFTPAANPLRARAK
jgi:hypothetical protein